MTLDLVATFVVGFFTATWIGTVLGIIKAWTPRVFLALLVGIAALVVVSLLAIGPNEYAMKANWAFVAGTIPGYAISFPMGEWLYRDMIDDVTTVGSEL